MANIGTRLVLTESDLTELLNDTIVKACIFWENVGLELGLPMHLIKKIDEDHCGTEDCKREMLYKWLINVENPTFEELRKAIQRVNDRHKREKGMDHTAHDERKAIKSICQIERLLDDWKQRNLKIFSDQKKLVDNLKKEEKWFENVKRWNDEKTQWQKGEIAERRKKIQQALGQRPNNSIFVQEFLQSKGYNSSHVKDEAVEGLLRQELMEIDIGQAETMGRHFKVIKIHHKQLEHLQSEILKYRELLEERLRAYDRIKQGLENIGAKKEKLDELNEQLKNMQVTAEVYIKTIDECDKIYREEKENLYDWENDLYSFITSFNGNINRMTQNLSDYEESLRGYFASIGGRVGSYVLPGVGTTVGATIGGAVGGVVGRFVDKVKAGWDSLQSKPDGASAEVDDQIQRYKATLERGKDRRDKLSFVLAD